MCYQNYNYDKAEYLWDKGKDQIKEQCNPHCKHIVSPLTVVVVNTEKERATILVLWASKCDVVIIEFHN
jgi:hypothetical protein